MTHVTTLLHHPAPSDRSVDRRAVLGGAAGVAAAGVVARFAPPMQAVALASTPAAKSQHATFVLVHGYWAGAWVWRDVIAGLRDAGQTVLATTGTGLGDRQHLANPWIDLDVYITDVVGTIETEDLHDVILVGWSYGGMVITGVAERIPERLAQVVYLDAVLPADGQSDYDTNGDAAEEIHAADLAAGEAAGMPGYVPVYEDFIRTWTKDPATQDWFVEHLVPQPIATSTQKLRVDNPAAAALPHVYLNCLEGKDDPVWGFTVTAVERAKTEPNWRVADLAENHMAPVNDPQLTVETLLSLI